MTTIEAMKQALDFLRSGDFAYPTKIATDLEQAIATEESSATQKPVAWGNFKEDGTLVGLSQHPEDQANWTNRKPLYIHPQSKREWVGLTNEEIEEAWRDSCTIDNGKGANLTNQPFYHFVKLAEAKLKEKNT